MKLLASVRLVIVGILVFTALEITVFLIFEQRSALLMALIAFQFCLIFLFMWLAYRLQRTQNSLTKLLDRSRKEYENSTKQIEQRIEDLSTIARLNTESLRTVAQSPERSTAHPRELRAIDDISVILSQLEELREDITTMNTD